MSPRKPLKYLFVATVSLIVLLMGVYLLRTTLITKSVNSLLANADVRVLQLGVLQLGWSDLSIDQLVLGVGPDDTRQTLQGVRLGYSLLDLQPKSLTIEAAALAVPQQAEQAQPQQVPVLLSGILEMLFAQPLQSAAIARTEVAGLAQPWFTQPFALNLSTDKHTISLRGSDGNKQIVLNFQRDEPNKFLLDASLSKEDKALLDFRLNLNLHKNTWLVVGEGEVQVNTVLPMLKSTLPVTESFTGGTGQVFYQMSAELEDDLLHLDAARGTLDILPTTHLSVELTNEEVSASLKLEMTTPAHVSLELGTAQSPEFTLTLDAASLQFSEAMYGLRGSIELSGAECSVFSAIQCRGGLNLAMSAARLQVPGDSPMTLVYPQLNASAQFSLQDSIFTADLLAGQWLRAELVEQDGLAFSGASLVGDSQASFGVDITSGAVNLEVAALRFVVPRAELAELSLETELHLQELTFSADGGSAYYASFHASSKALIIESAQLWLPIVAFDADVIVTDKALQLDGSVRGGGQQSLFQVEVGYKLSEQLGHARLYSEGLNFDADEMRLSKYFSSWPFNWDVLAGSVAFDSTVQWQGAGSDFQVVADIKQDMQGIAAVYQDIGIVGLTADSDLQFHSPDRLKTLRAVNISVDSIDMGVPIEAIEAKIEFDSDDQSVSLESVEAKLFGGRVWVEEAVYYADESHNKLFVGVDGVQLNQLLQHAGYDAVQATGSISGLLPLDVNTAGATMKRGMLAAKAPGGVFRYTAEVTTDISSTVTPVLAALGNYHYDVFQLEADYLDDGELQLAMVFRGSNPQVQQGRPIHLNLNVTDNIPALLKSLQSSRRITEAVEKKLGGG